ncbi:MAG: site-specific integrase [Planctomycetaceae bacterium]
MVKVLLFKRKGRKYYEAEFVDPRTEKMHRRSLKTVNKREAERLVGKLQKELEEGQFAATQKIKWKEFRARYLQEGMNGLAKSSRRDIKSTLDKYQKLLSPGTLQSVTEATISRFTTLIMANRSKFTVGKHLRNLKRMLRWAVRQKLLLECPHIDMPKGVSKGKAKGRAITTEEFERMLSKVAAVVGKKPTESWKALLRGLWLSGLRLGEALSLSWDDQSCIMVDVSGKYPMFNIPSDGDKSKKQRLLPIAPEFAEVLQAVPDEERTGTVFPLLFQRNHGIAPRVDTVSEIICDIGEKAGVKVSETKFASAHDLRRSFGKRWADKVKPHVLQQLMRHDSLETTMRYYVQSDADEIGAALWSVYDSEMRDTTTILLPEVDDTAQRPSGK